MAGCSFRDFMAGRLADRAGTAPATVGDFADHVTTAFTDVRLKQFLEMRGADAGSPAMMVAQSALWVGLLYDDAALTAADAVVRQYPWSDYAALRDVVPRQAMNTPWQGGSLRDLGREILAIAQDGLRARARTNGAQDERLYLDPLHEIVGGGLTQAENWLEKFNGPWEGNARLLLDEAQI
jgi:glutamate--cysteine ligase